MEAYTDVTPPGDGGNPALFDLPLRDPMALGDSSSSLSLFGYEVIDTLGNGARSTIYLARCVKTGKAFALKRVIRTKSEDQRFMDQAVFEHEVSQKFNHPSLRKSYKLIRHRKLLRVSEILVIMEAVHGQTLEQKRIRSMLEICRIFQDTAIALGVMHRAGYVHADIKPSNILVTEKDMVKIIDFGQSCPIGTKKQRIQGTPDYIAPEQVRREHITPMTDVFNLGASMYFVLTNKHVPTLIPKTGNVGQQLNSTKLNNECPAPVDINSDVPPALSSLVMNCIANEPRERPESMTRIYERLEMAIAQITTDRLPGGDGKNVADSSDAGSHDMERWFAK